MFPINILNINHAEENERREDIRAKNLERRLLRDSSSPFAVTDSYFIDLYRITKDMAHYLLNCIIPQLQRNNNNIHAIPSTIKFFAAFYFYATGSYQRTMGETATIAVAQQTMSRIITEVTDALLNRFAQELVQFPNDPVIKTQKKQRFMEKHHFPGVIGCVDGTHVAIIAPPEEEHNYLDRKGFHSKNIQIVCDYDLRILNVNATYAGATHDAYIWRHSLVHRELERCYEEGDRNSWLLGDSGYPQQPWLMTPFENPPEGTPEYAYNIAH